MKAGSEEEASKDLQPTDARPLARTCFLIRWNWTSAGGTCCLQLPRALHPCYSRPSPACTLQTSDFPPCVIATGTGLLTLFYCRREWQVSASDIHKVWGQDKGEKGRFQVGTPRRLQGEKSILMNLLSFISLSGVGNVPCAGEIRSFFQLIFINPLLCPRRCCWCWG